MTRWSSGIFQGRRDESDEVIVGTPRWIRAAQSRLRTSGAGSTAGLELAPPSEREKKLKEEGTVSAKVCRCSSSREPCRNSTDLGAETGSVKAGVDRQTKDRLRCMTPASPSSALG